MPTILAFETSCDETSVAVVAGDDQPEVIVNEVASQIDLHQQTGGVVPEVAAREQARAILPVLEVALDKAAAAGHPRESFDAIAYTKEPGLIGSLLVGIETAETLAELWDLPALPLHHIQSHLYGAFANRPPESVPFPAVALVVSGGHTQLWLMRSHLQFELMGATRDDAAGEAFDKIARLLDLPYPGGPSVSAAAERSSAPLAELLPRPMLSDPGLDFSFSGLKTAVLYRVRGRQLAQTERNDLAAEAQRAIVEVLVKKTMRAAQTVGATAVVLAGGVAANRALRTTLEESCLAAKIPLFVPDFSLCTDNAGMVGVLGWYKKLLAQAGS